jgi:hypothetical protein
MILLSAQRMHTVFDSSGDEFEISPPLAERTAEMVMEKMKNIMTIERQNIVIYEDNLQDLMNLEREEAD